MFVFSDARHLALALLRRRPGDEAAPGAAVESAWCEHLALRAMREEAPVSW